MKKSEIGKRIVFVCCLLFLVSVVSGCVVRSYTATKPRVDQDLAGNRGYIQGNIPASEDRIVRKKTRKVSVVEIELHSPIKFERGLPKSKAKKPTTEDEELWGNLGYLEGRPSAERKKVAFINGRKREVISYTVQKGDTLQKISMRFFGTTKKYLKIYKDNKDVLKSMEKIYPGQVIKIIK